MIEAKPTLQPYSWFHEDNGSSLDTLLSHSKDIAEGVSVLVRLLELNRESGDKILSDCDASSLERLSASTLQMLSMALDEHFASENHARRVGGAAK